MKTIGERIKYIRKDVYKLTLDRFGEKIGISNAAVSALETGKNNPSEQTVRMICREFRVNEEWLRNGIGAPIAPKSRDEEIADFAGQILDSGSAFQRAFVSVLARTTPEEWAIFEKKLTELIDELKKETDQ